MKCLIVGLGYSQLYKKILANLGLEVVTVSRTPNKADFTSVEDAISINNKFDISLICTPNFTHEILTRAVAPYARIVLVEKPGFKYSADWQQLVDDFPQTRFMMIKNNQWRADISKFKKLSNLSNKVKLNWINKGRTPSPGNWITDKQQSFGGASRDLMSHLLSIFQILNQSYASATVNESMAVQRYYLGQSDYTVDDFCKFAFTDSQRSWELTTDWKDMHGATDIIRKISFELTDGTVKTIDMGRMNKDAYLSMFVDAIKNVDNDSFWLLQLQYDLWIHKQLEQLSCTQGTLNETQSQ